MTEKLTDLPQWKALETHHAEFDRVNLRELFQNDPGRAERYFAQAGDLSVDYSKHLVTDETIQLLLDLARERGVFELRDRMFRGEKINITEDRAVLHVALRVPGDRAHRGRRHRRGAGGARGAPPDGRVLLPGPRRGVDRRDRQAHQDGRQHRYRRLGPGPGDGLRGAQAVQHARHAVPLRLQRGRRRPVRGHARPGPGRDAVRRLLQDLHHGRDRHQRHLGARSGCWPASAATRARSPSTSSRSPRTPRRSPPSASTPPTCSGSGTGSAAATPTTRRSACR